MEPLSASSPDTSEKCSFVRGSEKQLAREKNHTQKTQKDKCTSIFFPLSDVCDRKQTTQHYHNMNTNHCTLVFHRHHGMASGDQHDRLNTRQTMHAEFVLHLQTPNRSYHSYINNGINNNNECCKGLILD